MSTLFLIRLMFKCSKISLSKLSLRREFKTLWNFSFACFKLRNSFFSKSDSKELQREVFPDNCYLKTFEICCVKLLLRMLVPFLFKWSLVLFRWFALFFLLQSVGTKFFLLHISFKWLLFRLPFYSIFVLNSSHFFQREA